MQAIEAEATRQVEVLGGRRHGRCRKRGCSTPAAATRASMRCKEDAHDYRYFPDPDLLPLVLDEDWVEALQGRACPNCRTPSRRASCATTACPPTTPACWSPSRRRADFFETVAKGRDAKLAANWVTGDLFAALNRTGRDHREPAGHAPPALGGLLDLIADNTINGRIAKDVFEAMVDTGKAAGAIVEEKGLRQVTDTGAIDAAVDDGAGRQRRQGGRIPRGKDKLFGFFVGQVMKAMAGKGNPALVNEALKQAARLRGRPGRSADRPGALSAAAQAAAAGAVAAGLALAEELLARHHRQVGVGGRPVRRIGVVVRHARPSGSPSPSGAGRTAARQAPDHTACRSPPDLLCRHRRVAERAA